MESPPELDQPTTRSRLVEAFSEISNWGEHSPEAIQAMLDALDAETVPAVDSLDDLENIEGSNLPYVIKGDDQSPGELPDQAIPTGSQIKSLASSVSDQVQSVNAQTLNSVGSMSEISDPDDGDRYFVAELDTAVRYDGDAGKFEIEGRATTDGSGSSALPQPDQFKSGSEITTRGDGKTWEITA